ncbi:hypothetical protein llap_3461 [Limosa lapponica baueri]|uniref:Uncharacterized protein n=1 Tax=Limosa lapponica baueri TaxID=1758121 RepID=A0A2I0UJK2_LIMLA|nr:hypothetical protein llap_3461 [Limosa lapponica baueri]
MCSRTSINLMVSMTKIILRVAETKHNTFPKTPRKGIKIGHIGKDEEAYLVPMEGYYDEVVLEIKQSFVTFITRRQAVITHATEGKASFVQAPKGVWVQMDCVDAYCSSTEEVTHLAVHLSFLFAFYPIETEAEASCEDETPLASLAFFSDTTKIKEVEKVVDMFLTENSVNQNDF